MASAVRVLYPALAGEWQMSPRRLACCTPLFRSARRWGVDQRQLAQTRGRG
jgi:hypothetical protein